MNAFPKGLCWPTLGVLVAQNCKALRKCHHGAFLVLNVLVATYPRP